MSTYMTVYQKKITPWLSSVGWVDWLTISLLMIELSLGQAGLRSCWDRSPMSGRASLRES
jgi:hypothetical protein